MLTGPVAVSGGEVDWDAFHEGPADRPPADPRRGGGDDDELTELLGELMSAGNACPGESGEGVKSSSG